MGSCLMSRTGTTEGVVEPPAEARLLARALLLRLKYQGYEI